MTTPESKPTWGGPSADTPVGPLPACILCRRHLKHGWLEHLAQIERATDRLAKAAGIDPEVLRERS